MDQTICTVVAASNHIKKMHSIQSQPLTHTQENIFVKEMVVLNAKKNQNKKSCRTDSLILDRKGKDLTEKATLREEPNG